MKKQLFRLKRLFIAASLAASALVPMFTLAPLVSAGTNQCTWTGGGADNNWSTAANWTCSVGTVPDTGYDLIFPMANAPSSASPIYPESHLLNDLPSTNTYAGIWMTDNSTCSGDSGGYGIYGNGFQLSGDIIYSKTNDCTQRLELRVGDIILTADSTFDVYGSLSMGSHLTGTGENPTSFNIGAHNLNIIQDKLFSSIGSNREIVGTGTISLTAYNHNSLWLFSGSPSFDGDIDIISGELAAMSNPATALGSSVGQTFIRDGAMLSFSNDAVGNAVISENITFQGLGIPLGPGYFSEKLKIDAQNGSPFCTGSNIVGHPYFPSNTFTLNGILTLESDLSMLLHNDINITGDLIGSGFTLNVVDVGGGTANITSSTNTTNTPNGLLQAPLESVVYSDSLPSAQLKVCSRGEATITGSRGDVYVGYDGTLKGDGTVGLLSVQGGTVEPGADIGTMTVNNNLEMETGSTLNIELQGTAAGEFDQLDVTGTVDITDSILNVALSNGYTPANIGDSYTIINNDGTDAVTGTFNGLAEGAEISVGAVKFTISYVGGDGNDVVLTTAYIPGPPGTGFDVFKQSYLAPAVIIAVALIGLVYSSKRTQSLRKTQK